VRDIFFRCHYVFVVMHLQTRRMLCAVSTREPTAEWLAQQLRHLTPFGDAVDVAEGQCARRADDRLSLQRVLDEYRRYFNDARPHQGIGQGRPNAFAQDPRVAALVPPATIVARPVLDGLHHDYPAAA
jgi:hypothetical protein